MHELSRFVEAVDIDRSDVTSALGYKNNYIPQGFEIPHDDVQAHIKETYGGPAGLVEALAGKGARHRVWWVNQNQTFPQERQGGFLWAPKRNRNGRTQRHWEALTRAKPGDTVLSYVGGEIRAVSRVKQGAVDASPPSEHFSAWDGDGRRLDVDYRDISDGVSLRAIPVEWRIREEDGPLIERAE